VREYVLSTDGFLNPGKLRSIFDSFEGIAFAGHTHHGGVLDSAFKFHGLSGDTETTFEFEDAGQYFVNVGSVGQPRDGDSRACYAILEPTKVTWHRIPYDYRATQAKIRSHSGLTEILASRLAMGR
jgi:diadenosine tetraphosphatase ApaH/serine/threonine PP2A family protein phosphatase